MDGEAQAGVARDKKYANFEVVKLFFAQSTGATA
jgi:hypothetical protein